MENKPVTKGFVQIHSHRYENEQDHRGRGSIEVCQEALEEGMD